MVSRLHPRRGGLTRTLYTHMTMSHKTHNSHIHTHAQPVLQSAFASLAQPGDVLAVCAVQRSEYRGNPAYAYRTHKGVRLACVPTFGQWRAGRIEMPLNDAQSSDAEAVHDVLTAAKL